MTNITKITTSSNYIDFTMCICGEKSQEIEMAHYRQTLIIPAPKQNLNQIRPVRRAYGKCKSNENRNQGINSILAYFN